MASITRIEDIGKDGSPPWAIDGIVSGLTVLWGDPGVGKTFVAISMAASVATGRPWLGHRTAHGQVVYVAGEGGLTNVGHRLRTALAYWGVDDIQDYQEDLVDLSVVIPGVDLVSNAAELYELIGNHSNLKLLIIDTLSRCLVGDENKQEDMAKFVRTLDVIKVELGCDILIIHHPNRKHEIRGSSVLFGAVDVSWHLTEVSKNFLNLSAEKLRERDSDHGELRLQLHPTPILGRNQETVFDELGDIQTTLVIKPDPETISHVKQVTDTGKLLLSSLQKLGNSKTINYADWFAAMGWQKVTFDNALSYILSYPGKWGITRGEKVGTYRLAEKKDE